MKYLRINIAAILFACMLLLGARPPQEPIKKEQIAGWKLEFWKIKDIDGDFLSVGQGDTLTISWVQQLKSIPYKKQMSFGIGDTTGQVIRFYVPLSSVINILASSDSAMSIQYIKPISLSPGMWSLVMYTKGKNELWSKHSRPFWFRVKEKENAPPEFPVQIMMWIKE